MTLERPFLDDVCKIGQGPDCCRYLVANAKGIQCGKLDTSLHRTIDARVASNTFTAKGDHCDGLPMDQ